MCRRFHGRGIRQCGTSGGIYMRVCRRQSRTKRRAMREEHLTLWQKMEMRDIVALFLALSRLGPDDTLDEKMTIQLYQEANLWLATRAKLKRQFKARQEKEIEDR